MKRFLTMFCVGFVTSAIFVLFVAATTSCKPKKCETNPGSLECKAISAAIDCTIGDLGDLVQEVLPIVEGYVSSNTADGVTDWSKVDLRSLGAKEGTCILTQMLLKRPVPVPEPTTPTPTTSRHDDLEHQLVLHMQRNHIDPTTHVHTVIGDR